MATQLQIYNMAISAARGEGTLRSITQKTRAREECDKWYDLLIDVVQEAAYWPCCKTRALLAGQQSISDHAFSYSYELPADYLRAWYLADLEKFALESDVAGTPLLFTEVASPTLYYARRVTDTSRWTPGMTEAIVYGLAARISDSLTGRDNITNRLVALSQAKIGEAQSASINATDPELLDSLPDFLQARGGVATASQRFYYPYGEGIGSAS